MTTYTNIIEATNAASQFFAETFGYNSGATLEKKSGNVYEFYSNDDPAMDDTFTCIVDDGQPTEWEGVGA